jgi:hypothetical protein
MPYRLGPSLGQKRLPSCNRPAEAPRRRSQPLGAAGLPGVAASACQAQELRSRAMKKLIAPIALLALVLYPASASATTMMHSGKIVALVNPAQASGGTGTIFIVGVIADYGTTVNVTAAGKPSQDYSKINLTKGSFEVNLTTLNKVTNAETPSFSPTTCMFWGSGSGPITLSNGTGAYAGITGTLTVHETFVGVAPRLASGRCNMDQNAKPTHQTAQVTATGSVSF